jgi:hypothetical protein
LDQKALKNWKVLIRERIIVLGREMAFGVDAVVNRHTLASKPLADRIVAVGRWHNPFMQFPS